MNVQPKQTINVTTEAMLYGGVILNKDRNDDSEDTEGLGVESLSVVGLTFFILL